MRAGTSGGPLLNAHGQVVGVMSCGFAPGRGQSYFRNVDLAQPDHGVITFGLDVNVARAILDCGQQSHIHQIHDRAAGDHLVQIGGRVFIDSFALDDLNVRIRQ